MILKSAAQNTCLINDHIILGPSILKHGTVGWSCKVDDTIYVKVIRSQ